MCEQADGTIVGEYELVEKEDGFRGKCKECGQFLTLAGTERLLAQTSENRQYRSGE